MTTRRALVRAAKQARVVPLVFPVQAAESAGHCAGGVRIMVQFRKVVVAHEATVQVGFMTKALPVEVCTRKGQSFIHFRTTADWVSKALFGVGRSRRPAFPKSRVLATLMKVGLGGVEEDSLDSALAEEADPLLELISDGDCAGGQPEDTEPQELETPKKRSRKHLTAAEQEFCITVRMSSLVPDFTVFQPEHRADMEHSSVRILCKTNRRRALFIHEDDLYRFMFALHTEIERFGVPAVGPPEEESALADVPQWFDTRTSRWCVRRGDEVHTSQPVPRTGANGRPLAIKTFQRGKEQVLQDLLAKLG